MVRRMIVFILLVMIGCSVSLIVVDTVRAQTAEEAGKKAAEIHLVASSDVIYTEAELKALYYQNIQIIEILKDIRNILQLQAQSKEKEKK
ncbi:MAG TPA: hypothetical protein VJA17_04285 [Candidatus Omnitrophota bacterium]|nr:hypothetical protein [Candidatus Omnitrophota bacterium]